MTDLARFGMTLVGFAIGVVVLGIVIGLIGAGMTRRRAHPERERKAA